MGGYGSGSDRGGMGNRSNLSGGYSQGGGSMNVSASGGGYNSGIDSNRSGGKMSGPGSQDFQDVEPNSGKGHGSSGGIEDLKSWLKAESGDKYKQSLDKLHLDPNKIEGKHLVSYSLDELQNEKKRVKNELKVYD
jgi:hypothetical protein